MKKCAVCKSENIDVMFRIVRFDGEEKVSKKKTYLCKDCGEEFIESDLRRPNININFPKK